MVLPTGVTSAVAVPLGNLFLGVSTAFSTGAAHKLESGAVVQDFAAVHVTVQPVGLPSVSTQIAALRRLLLREGDGEASKWFSKIREVRAIAISRLRPFWFSDHRFPRSPGEDTLGDRSE